MIKLCSTYNHCPLPSPNEALLLHTDVEAAIIVSASRIGSLAESILIRHSNERAARARLTVLVHGAVNTFVKPWHTLPEPCLDGFNSSMMVGDVEYAILCGQLCILAKFHIGTELIDIQGMARDFIRFMVRLCLDC